MLDGVLAPLMSSADGTWQTPDNVLELVRRVGNIGLDPCTVESNPTGAWHFCTPEHDGLARPWKAPGNSLIYVNPPYGRGIGAWIAKCHAAAAEGNRVIALLPARTDTKWFPWNADAACFWKGRLTFRGADAPAPFPSVVVWWHRGASRQLFKRVFDDAGKVVML